MTSLRVDFFIVNPWPRATASAAARPDQTDIPLRHRPFPPAVRPGSLLRLFVQHAGKVLTHRQILREVWGPNYVEQTHYLRVYVGHLRDKLESDPARPTLLTTEPGVGYRLIVD